MAKNGQFPYVPAHEPNPNKDFIKALDLLEEVRALPAILTSEPMEIAVRGLAKMFTQALQDQLSAAPGGLTPEEMVLARDNKRIPAIRLVRERTGLGMIEAKELVETWQRKNNVDPYGGQA